MPYIDENGEVFEKIDLIKAIESLLNRVSEEHKSYFSPEIAQELDMQTLVSIRKSLLEKCGEEIAQNQEWLLGLADPIS